MADPAAGLSRVENVAIDKKNRFGEQNVNWDYYCVQQSLFTGCITDETLFMRRSLL